MSVPESKIAAVRRAAASLSPIDYLALVLLGLLLLYLALVGPERFAKRGGTNEEDL